MTTPIHFLESASWWANKTSACAKVKVGAVIATDFGPLFGSNRVDNNACPGVALCNVGGHCVRTIHAEIDAIAKARCNLIGATIYVTRYPCEACARAIIAAGIARVYYGRATKASAWTLTMLHEAGVQVVHVPEHDEEDYNAQG